jgi:predicted DNA binding CopG/RHH family protein
VLPEIVAAYQRGDFKQTPQVLKSNDENQINIQLNPVDISFVKAKAQETGIPFQAIIGALVHNYAIGKIKLEI